MHLNSRTSNLPIRMESEIALRMAEAASAFVASLSGEQKKQVVYPVKNEERLKWDYRPRERKGISLKEMDGGQQKQAFALLSTGLSRRGAAKAFNIMGLDKVLADLEGQEADHPFNPDHYYITLFGSPSDKLPWGWRFEGHHLSLNYLIAEGRHIACTPNFFGANPATVPEGPMLGFRTLPEEEDHARQLLASLGESQRKKVWVSDQAPTDIVTRWYQRVTLEDPVGLPLGEMSESQEELLMKLLGVYTGRVPRKAADARLNAIQKEGTRYIHFGWAGSEETGKPHYYRLHGPSFVVEYDNTQNNANHIHTVWRDIQDDWGEDLLKRHYSQSHD